MTVRWWMAIWGCVALVAGCENPVPQPAPEPPVAPSEPERRTFHLNHAQPRLTTTKLWLGAEELTVELALTQTQIATGMMFREEMPDDEGMLFVFPAPHQTGFYMKNTIVPLSAAYIGADGKILEIVDLHPKDETPKHSKTDQVQYVLEVNQGWFKRKGMGPGTILRTARGSLEETFFRKQ